MKSTVGRRPGSLSLAPAPSRRRRQRRWWRQSGWDGKGSAIGCTSATPSRKTLVHLQTGIGLESEENRIELISSNTKDKCLGAGLSGLRVGVLYSQNAAALAALQKLNDLCQVSSQTQASVRDMLDDEPWLQHFEATTRQAPRRFCRRLLCFFWLPGANLFQ